MEKHSLKILLTGSSGLVGSDLVPYLEEKGHEVIRLVRSSAQARDKTVLWNPLEPISDLNFLEGFEAVVHLAGEGIATGRWTEAKKVRIRDSRVKSTRFLSEGLAQLKKPPKVFACASAIGIYGNQGEKWVNEESPAGKGFLAEVAQEWEAACEPARKKGIRVVNLRFGMLLSPKGGALGKMLLPFQWGLGGVIGSGRQYISWMTLPDVVRAVEWVLKEEKLKGPVNFVSPHPVTNREWTKTLGKVLHRPTLFSVPAFAAKIAFGEMAEEALLASARVEPKQLLDSGFNFKNKYLEESIRSLL